VKLLGLVGNTIECSLEQVKVSQGGYQALSYVWGSEERPFHALVRDSRGKELGIIYLTQNLNAALRNLWNAEGVSNKVFWIDQICIDQQGEEKNHQVALMHKIYQNAARVITDTGSTGDEDEEERGVELLDRLTSHFSPNFKVLADILDMSEARRRKSELPVLELPMDLAGDAVSDETWQWLVALCFGEWTTRLWMVQEQMLNAKNVILHGSRILNWEGVAIVSTLFFLDMLLDRHVSIFWQEGGRHTAQRDPWEYAKCTFAIWSLRKRALSETGHFEPPSRLLAHNMSYFEQLECQDPRDHVFALLAISSDTTTLGITADYTSTTSEIFLSSSIPLFENSQYLDTLVMSCRRDNLADPSVPSWAVTIPRERDVRPLNLIFDIYTPHPFISAPNFPRYSSVGGDHVLTVKGRILDHISFATSPIYESNSIFLGIGDLEYTKSLWLCIKNLANVFEEVGASLENAARLCRNMVPRPDWTPSAKNGSLGKKNAYHFWCHSRWILSYINGTYERLGVDFDIDSVTEILVTSLAPLILGDDADEFSTDTPLTAEEKEAAMYVWHSGTLRGRSLCTTDEGRICNGMNKVQKGDVVAALQGAERLYILRPSGSRYKVIGDAFVDGLMNGEAYEGIDPNDVDHDIELI
jgi:hypothetical protein